MATTTSWNGCWLCSGWQTGHAGPLLPCVCYSLGYTWAVWPRPCSASVRSISSPQFLEGLGCCEGNVMELILSHRATVAIASQGHLIQQGQGCEEVVVVKLDSRWHVSFLCKAKNHTWDPDQVQFPPDLCAFLHMAPSDGQTRRRMLSSIFYTQNEWASL